MIVTDGAPSTLAVFTGLRSTSRRAYSKQNDSFRKQPLDGGIVAIAAKC